MANTRSRKQSDVTAAFAADDELKPGTVVRERPADRRVLPPPPVEERVWIMLEDNDKIPPTGQFFQVVLEHKVHSWQLRSGEAAHVPKALLNVMNDCIEDVPQIDPESGRVIGYRQRLRFPYRIVNPPRAAA